MPAVGSTAEGDELLSYKVASGDMRFIEIGERALYLRIDPQMGRVIRGEVPQCGPDCFVNLSHVLLEYIMSCGDCREARQASAAAERFGKQLGQKLLKAADGVADQAPDAAQFAQSVRLVLDSMDVPYEVEATGDSLRFSLATCPLHATAHATGLGLYVAFAHRALVALLDTLRQGLAPGWERLSPLEPESEAPLQSIEYARP